MKGRLVFILSAIAAVAGAATMVASPAHAAESAHPVIRSPFTCGQTWFARTYKGHEANAVDWNMAGGSNADHGQPVLAGAAGVATVKSDPSGYGTYVVVNHGGGWSSLYAHLSAVTIKSGQAVDSLTMVGRVGNTGGSAGSHLHHEQQLNGVRQPVVLDGVAIRPSTNSRGQSYQSQNCAPRTATVQLFSDANRTKEVVAEDVAPGTPMYARVTAPAGVRPVGSVVATGGPSVFAAAGWVNSSQPLVRVADLAGRWSANFDIVTPSSEGTFAERFAIDDALHFDLAVATHHHLRWDRATWRTSLDKTGRVPTRGDQLMPGQVLWMRVQARNASTFAWTQSNVVLQTVEPDAHASVLHHRDWLTNFRPTTATGVITGGETTEFVFPIVAPSKPGNYTESFAVATDGHRMESAPVVVKFKVVAATGAGSRSL